MWKVEDVFHSGGHALGDDCAGLSTVTGLMAGDLSCHGENKEVFLMPSKGNIGLCSGGWEKLENLSPTLTLHLAVLSLCLKSPCSILIFHLKSVCLFYKDISAGKPTKPPFTLWCDFWKRVSWAHKSARTIKCWAEAQRWRRKDERLKPIWKTHWFERGNFRWKK